MAPQSLGQFLEFSSYGNLRGKQPPAILPRGLEFDAFDGNLRPARSWWRLLAERHLMRRLFGAQFSASEAPGGGRSTADGSC